MTQQIVFALVSGFLVALLLFIALSRLFKSKNIVPADRQSRFSEQDAERLLKESGFTILGKNQRESIVTVVDGKDHYGFLEADYTVQKGRDKFVVVVHTGEGTSDPNEPLVRRKLLEYARVFSGHIVLVLDLNSGEIHQVRFRFPHERNIDFFFQFLLGVFIISGVIGIIWVLAQLHLF
ncbi:MAG: hypothetical protein ABIE84_03980 [bacterium]